MVHTAAKKFRVGNGRSLPSCRENWKRLYGALYEHSSPGWGSEGVDRARSGSFLELEIHRRFELLDADARNEDVGRRFAVCERQTSERINEYMDRAGEFGL